MIDNDNYDINSMTIQECILVKKKYDRFYKSFLENEFHKTTGKTITEVEENNLTNDGVDIHNGLDFENIISNIATLYKNKYPENEKTYSEVITRINTLHKEQDKQYKIKRNEEIINLVMRQTTYTYEEIINRLQNCNNDYIQVIRQYNLGNINEKKKEESNSVQSRNQEIYKQIRNFMDHK